MKIQVWLGVVAMGVWISGTSVLALELDSASATRNDAPTEASQSQITNEDRLREVLRQYIRGCNTGDAALLTSTFAEDVKAYFIELPPVQGRATLVSTPTFTRGVDWFLFRDGKISEIRQYYDVRNILTADQRFELNGFPYKDRNYPGPDDLDSRLP
jgi:hypothetical protein